jgi:hypothetical protein
MTGAASASVDQRTGGGAAKDWMKKSSVSVSAIEHQVVGRCGDRSVAPANSEQRPSDRTRALMADEIDRSERDLITLTAVEFLA